MQSEMTDFAPSATNWQTWQNIRTVSDSVHSLYYVKMQRNPKN